MPTAEQCTHLIAFRQAAMGGAFRAGPRGWKTSRAGPTQRAALFWTPELTAHSAAGFRVLPRRIAADSNRPSSTAKNVVVEG